MILVALHKETSLNPASKLLLRSLAITDLGVGVLGQPLTVAVIFSALFERLQLSRVIQIWSHGILCVVSILTLTTISVDRLLALLLRLRYKQVVTLKRVRVPFSCFEFQPAWLAFFLFGSSLFSTYISSGYSLSFLQL